VNPATIVTFFESITTMCNYHRELDSVGNFFLIIDNDEVACRFEWLRSR
jgi:hypothetical protein